MRCVASRRSCRSSPQTLPTLKNGVCVPQKPYRKGVGRDSPLRDLVVFFRQDGSYIPVKEALEENYDGLILRDVPTLGGTGHTVTIRFEVNTLVVLGDTTVLIYCAVAGLSSGRVAGALADMLSLVRV